MHSFAHAAILTRMITNGPLFRNIKRSNDFRNFVVRGDWYFGQVPSYRSLLTGALFDVASEHHASIGHLLLSRRSSSAQALLRPLVETALRVMWIMKCSDSQIDAIKNKRGKRDGWLDLAHTITEIESQYRSEKFLKKYFPNTDFLDDLTHGGMGLAIGKLAVLLDLQKESFEKDANFCIFTADRTLVLMSLAYFTNVGNKVHTNALSAYYAAVFDEFEHASAV
ncbi:DUF6988 family protein [Terriglobus saanensis]|uniref:Uncharacterized protein n=1 Tax=Terriglobus saanensis (strain ATCC BAA-1853 / DSM 23119 / SP1PR4) TaxID=401053 RepID=E8V2Q8_TERSS|nr:hypothetical protein [Terriglobus saanensis]ADV83533.1 hypothetical protein AciPR4_2760 [Terriglobus saanensis SP1PR4]